MVFDLQNCNLCPQNCYADRTVSGNGTCRSDSGYNIASIVLHKGEEPVISGDKGIINIFFSGCNLRCIYCQNYQISRKTALSSEYVHLDSILKRVEELYSTGAKSAGFVSPSHVFPQAIEIIENLKKRFPDLILVYNTNSYEKAGNIKRLEGLIDVYLPDFKYWDPELSFAYSRARNYGETAFTAIKEMYRQKGSRLFVSDDGIAEQGIIIRHLVLPGNVENSLNVLRVIAEEISTNIHISLMSQYYPVSEVLNHEKLGRSIKEEEYNKVLEEMDHLGFRNGYTQELESREMYRPDFKSTEPFA